MGLGAGRAGGLGPSGVLPLVYADLARRRGAGEFDPQFVADLPSSVFFAPLDGLGLSFGLDLLGRNLRALVNRATT